jgi:hypothetical protein
MSIHDVYETDISKYCPGRGIILASYWPRTAEVATFESGSRHVPRLPLDHCQLNPSELICAQRQDQSSYCKLRM